ncbi:MAG: outer membrane protein assembly factor BamD [Archangiaceae bacterium]|nr:outer membrane protein assembly factor BamD [Archangiaceae bacterium]
MTSPWREKNDALGSLLSRAKAGGELDRPGSRERVWRSLQQQPRRPGAGWLLVPAGALAAALLAFVLLRAPVKPPAAAGPFATLTLAAGDVQASSGAEWSAARVGQQLGDGAQLKTAGKSRAYTRLTGGGALLREGTRARLSRQKLALEDGTLVAAATAPLHLEVRQYGVEVEAAVFQLDAAADQVTLQVAEGSARVRGPSTDVTVRAGQRWSSRDGTGRAELSNADLSTARALAAAPADGAVLRIARPVGALVTLDGVELGTAPLEVATARGAHQVGAAQGSLRTTITAQAVGGLTLIELPAPEPKPLPDVTFEPMESPPVVDPRPAAKLEPPADPGKRYLLARSLAQRGRTAEALALYQGLTHSDSGWAEPSLYEVGRLNLRALKNPAAALEALDAYRARYPRGSLAHEVALSSIEAQLKLGAGPAALEAMDDFLARFLESERRADVRFVRATVRRDRGDCAGAAADYLELLTDPAHADDALYFAAVCEQQLGEDAAARRHLTEYLGRFPAGAHRAEVTKFFEGGHPSGNSRAP